MRLFDKIFGADKIKVQFIDNLTGQSIGVSEMYPNQLPDTFSVPTVSFINFARPRRHITGQRSQTQSDSGDQRI
jgi:hypothetical protein